ncbi:MAG: 50S ribosome-binding GTPase, partial [Planctomycetia bacterium]|nr:50S ribosome-binding GTPase [Planctomycetia bacterium]
MYHLDDTIAAIATAPGPGARGIVRVSGPGTVACLADFSADDGRTLESAKVATAVAGHFRLPGLHSPLPAEVYLWPNERSYTRQPLAEVHTIGSQPLLAMLLRAVCRRGARTAEPGEFTLRAFLSGRIDLAQAEAVLGVIEAEDAEELRVALDQLAGGVTGALVQLREQLLDLLAHLEAGLDFVEEDIAFITREELTGQLAAAQATVEKAAAQMAKRSIAVERVRIVLAGWPNVGKSSLFNALAGREAAIVSPQAGTTRDYLTADEEL